METDSGASSEAGKAKDAEIDEGLYSRQLYVMGHDAQRRVGESKVLIVGANGLGVEIAKNVVLAGVKSVTIHDNSLAKVEDLGSQFYLTEADIGKPRSKPTVEKLSALNEYVRLEAYEGDVMDKEFISKFNIVVVADAPLQLKLDLNTICRQTGAKFIACQINGLFANTFCDFGEEFTVTDTNGEAPISRMVSSISSSNPAIVQINDDVRLELETGAKVRFTEVQGMTELNSMEPMEITVKSPTSFEIQIDSAQLAEYVGGGYVHEVKVPKVMHFKPLSEALERPGEFLLTDFAKFGRSELLHFGFQALEKFKQVNNNAYPDPTIQEHCDQVIAFTKELAEAASKAAAEDPNVVQLDEDGVNENAEGVIRALAAGAAAELAPMAAFLGGVVGQEVLKACSGKFTPLHQFLYFDAVECLPDEYPLSPEECKPEGSRYDGEIQVFGRSFVKKLHSLNMFLVGAGAIGCEMLKNWALMGVACGAGEDGSKGVVHITDMDKIERSNLNRQFLFRPSDVGSSKSTAAARAVTEMNNMMTVQAYEDKVAPDTENVFGDDFFAKLDMVCTALDNVEARLYVDQRCLNYAKPMLESGTLGTKGNTQVVVPFLTENYGASRDPPEKSVPVCTLKNFPYEIAHCVQWARDWFEGAFTQAPRNVNQYLSTPDFVERLDAQQNGKITVLESLKSSLVTERPRTFEECIKWARLQFEDRYVSTIKQLLFSFPPGMTTSTGAPFWSGTKREPVPLEFDPEDPEHMEFLIAGANLRASNYNLQGDRDPARFRAYLPQIEIPEFKPRSIKVATNEAELKQQEEEDMDADVVAKRIVEVLPSRNDLAGVQLKEAEFEKDDDTNFHMDFITAASNLRARNYGIGEMDKYETKRIAGKIIPAIATTTALVTGLVCLELYKLAQGKKDVESYKCGFCNLALPFFAFSEPIEVKKTLAGTWEWSIWDKIDIDGTEKPMTLADFIQFFTDKYGVEVNMLSYAVSILHSVFTQPQKKAARMKMTMSELVENVTKAPIDPDQKFLSFEVICVDSEDNDVEFPPVRYRIRR